VRSEAVIEARGLSKRYGVVAALDSVDLDVARAEAVRLAGKNGAGKTTLLRILATLEHATSGNVSINGLTAREDGPRIRALVGYLPDRPQFYEDLTPHENLRFFADLFGVMAARFRERQRGLWAALELDEFGSKRSGALSRGQKQKLALACALVHAPSIILLDEPHAGLDDAGVASVDALIETEKARGATIIVASHAHVPNCIDRTIQLDRGRLVGFLSKDQAMDRIPLGTVSGDQRPPPEAKRAHDGGVT
jgi:ABC-type multidrug transport system ATPase subunit